MSQKRPPLSRDFIPTPKQCHSLREMPCGGNSAAEYMLEAAATPLELNSEAQQDDSVLLVGGCMSWWYVEFRARSAWFEGPGKHIREFVGGESG